MQNPKPIQLFYPCRENKHTGKHSIKLTKLPMTYENALAFIENSLAYSIAWSHCEISIQPIDHPYFVGVNNNAKP